MITYLLCGLCFCFGVFVGRGFEQASTADALETLVDTGNHEAIKRRLALMRK